MKSEKIIKLGTRRSLLAVAQSSWVARAVEAANPGVKVELVGIDTRGDLILDVPLQKVEGKDFFVAELDQALKDGRVDFNVHSMKDLSLERPAEFVMAAIPKRENARDAVLFSSGALEKLKKGLKLKIGTSSPRRLENLPSLLDSVLPFFESTPRTGRCEFVEIRGNVNTRLSRIHEREGHEKQLDGVVLALAGLIRLSRDEKASKELDGLLKGARWMILPLRENPTAPAQGALAIECRKEDREILAALSKIDDYATRAQAIVERRVLSQYGGGCHQRFGASAMSLQGVGEILFVRGKDTKDNILNEVRFRSPEKPKGSIRIWNGRDFRSKTESEDEPLLLNLKPLQVDSMIFVAHSRAFTRKVREKWDSKLTRARIFTSGLSSWVRLADQGVWVEACAEDLGFLFLSDLLKERVLGLPPLSETLVLTHNLAKDSDSENSWASFGIENPIATYVVTEKSDSPEMDSELASATHIFWSSASQFEAYSKRASLSAIHSCGAGKTALALKKKLGDKLHVFPSVKEWQSWLTI